MSNVIKKEEIGQYGTIEKFDMGSLSAQDSFTTESIDGLDTLQRKVYQERYDDDQFPHVSQPKIDLKGVERYVYQKGFREGLGQGVDEACRQLKSIFEAAGELTKELERKKVHLFREAEHDLVSLAVAIAQKIIKEEIKLNKEVIITITKTALEQVIDKGKTTIRLNPQDVGLIKEAQLDLATVTGGEGKFEVVADGSIQEGGCIVQSESSSVDAQIKTQIEEIEVNLLKKGKK